MFWQFLYVTAAVLADLLCLYVLLQVEVGRTSVAQPYALLTPETQLPAGHLLAPLAKAAVDSSSVCAPELPRLQRRRQGQELSLLSFTIQQVSSGLPCWSEAVQP